MGTVPSISNSALMAAGSIVFSNSSASSDSNSRRISSESKSNSEAMSSGTSSDSFKSGADSLNGMLKVSSPAPLRPSSMEDKKKSSSVPELFSMGSLGSKTGFSDSGSSSRAPNSSRILSISNSYMLLELSLFVFIWFSSVYSASPLTEDLIHYYRCGS